VTNVSPNTGGAATSTTIRISGAGFVAASTLTLDGRGTAATFISATELRAIAPPHPAGAIDVVVTNPNGETGRLNGGFTYVDRPVSLMVTGNTTFEAPGERSQLTATAVHADGTTTDVTGGSRWFSSLPGVASITSDGVLTAQGLGTSQILVQFPATNAFLSKIVEATVTPRGTSAVSGRVREPGAGGIFDASVVHEPSGSSTRTDAAGNFSFGGLTGSMRFSATKDGFEPATGEVTPGEFFALALQRVVRLAAAGPAYTGNLAPNDVEYVIDGTSCQPCRLIRITNANGGSVSVTLRWTSAVDLHVWSDGRRIDRSGDAREIVANIEVRGGESVIYIGKSKPESVEDYVAFSLTLGPTGAAVRPF
jgi:hypothetical protein